MVPPFNRFKLNLYLEYLYIMVVTWKGERWEGSYGKGVRVFFRKIRKTGEVLMVAPGAIPGGSL